MIDERTFRADLYFRLSAIELKLPPLRKRIDDIPLLMEHFNEVISESLCLPCTPFSEDIKQAFMRYTWPGNVRELRNVIERSLILAGEGAQVKDSDLPVHISNARSLSERFHPPLSIQRSLGFDEASSHSEEWKADEESRIPRELSADELAERERISHVLLENDGNLSKSASALGLSRTTLYKRMEQFGMRVRVVVDFDS